MNAHIAKRLVHIYQYTLKTNVKCNFPSSIIQLITFHKNMRIHFMFI